MKTEETEDVEMRLGSPVTCQKCGEKSFHPFYACKKNCPLSISGAEKDQVHYQFEPTHVTCQELKKPCGNKKISGIDLSEHLKNRHNIRTLHLYPELPGEGNSKLSGIVHIALPANKLHAKEDFRWPTTTFMFDDLQFYVGAVVDPKRKPEPTVHFWVYLNGPEKLAKQFMYSFTVESSKKPLNWFRGVHSWSYYDFNNIRSRRETVPVPVKCLSPLVKKQEGKHYQKYFNVEIKMIKPIKNGIPTP